MALAAPKTAMAKPATIERVNDAVDALAASLAELHGGNWRVTVDHKTRFVLIHHLWGAQ